MRNNTSPMAMSDERRSPSASPNWLAMMEAIELPVEVIDSGMLLVLPMSIVTVIALRRLQVQTEQAFPAVAHRVIGVAIRCDRKIDGGPMIPIGVTLGSFYLNNIGTPVRQKAARTGNCHVNAKFHHFDSFKEIHLYFPPAFGFQTFCREPSVFLSYVLYLQNP